jgi:2-polyprenyl-6-methoxyphenol hydroxylase-like FAD-dependent oxidoreductase
MGGWELLRLLFEQPGCCSGVSLMHVAGLRAWVQVAEAFQQGPIFLAGDAAHRFPPAGGFGMNTGIQVGGGLLTWH